MRLAVNIDHVATVREARKAREPEPVAAAVIAELAGAQGITVHLRSDRRHIKERDLELLRRVVSTKLNVEMAATEEMTTIAARIRPDQVTLVPERPNELTTEGGLDVVSHLGAVRAAAERLHGAGIKVSVFIDPDNRQVTASREAGADAIEINTGAYSELSTPREGEPAASGAAVDTRLTPILSSAHAAACQGLEVLAGHGLTYVNVRPIAAITEIAELNIGHSIIARSVLVGLDRAVREMVALLS